MKKSIRIMMLFYFAVSNFVTCDRFSRSHHKYIIIGTVVFPLINCFWDIKYERVVFIRNKQKNKQTIKRRREKKKKKKTPNKTNPSKCCCLWGFCC